MFGSILKLFAVGFLLAACAHPNYKETPVDPTEEQLGTCDIDLKDSKMCASFSWDILPADDKDGSFVLEFHGDHDASQVVDLIVDLGVVLWMPGMGHGSKPVEITHLGNGQYRVSNVFFVMHGDWEIQVQLKNKKTGQILDQAVYPVRY
jgi:hypothetical protein